MKTYKFTAEALVEAENQEEAEEKFANNSFDFASQAECEEITEERRQNERIIG